MMERVTAAALPDVQRFLRSHEGHALLPLTLLEQSGLGALDVWLRRTASGGVSDVLMRNTAGLVMPQCPTGPWDAAARALEGRRCTVILGPATQARALVEACGLSGVAGRVDRDEPFLTLELETLEIPPGPGRLLGIADAPRDTIIDWLRCYLEETLALTGNMATIAALENYDNYCAAGSHVVLMEDGVPLSMTGFSAHQPQTVQVDGVFTPKAFRCLGLARRIVALHLAQARQAGVTQAVLSASGPGAVRSYEAIGFRQTGTWSLCLFDPAQIPRLTVPEPAT